MKQEIKYKDNIIWYTQNYWESISFYNDKEELIAEKLSYVELIDASYSIIDAFWEKSVWKWLIKLWYPESENIYSADSESLLFEDWFWFINPIIARMYKLCRGIIVSTDVWQQLFGIDWKILSPEYDRIEAPEWWISTPFCVSKWEEFNYIDSSGNEISSLWFDDCHDFSTKKYTWVQKGESINYIDKDWVLLHSEFFDELIHISWDYAIIKTNGEEIIIWEQWKVSYSNWLINNKYFQSEIIYEGFENDSEFIALFVFLDYELSKHYQKIESGEENVFCFWNIDPKASFDILMTILVNYNSYENVHSFMKEIPHNLEMHPDPVSWREALLSSALYHTLESYNSIGEIYRSSVYYNLCLEYLDANFKRIFQSYIDDGVALNWEDKFEWWQKQYILWELMYDVRYWENIHLPHSSEDWTPFCTWRYMECLR